MKIGVFYLIGITGGPIQFVGILRNELILILIWDTLVVNWSPQ